MTVRFALLAGLWGAVHDQVTFSLSPEYFLKFKFLQFGIAGLPWSPHWLAALTGVMASAWVGALAGLWLGLLGIWRPYLYQRWWPSVTLLATIALAGGLLGYLTGVWWLDRFGAAAMQRFVWPGVVAEYDFLLVGFVHTGSYAGAVVGLVLATVMIIRQQTAEQVTRQLHTRPCQTAVASESAER